MDSIWEKLEKPIFCLAPMEDVTDTVFRQLLVEIGKPPLMFSEFTNVRHIYSHSTDYRRLEYTQPEKPLILQIWGMEPELYYQVACLAVELGFDGIDINMGCPQKKIVKKGACSALIDNPDLAQELIAAAKEGSRGAIPVSVKTRIGFKEKVTEKWTSFLLEQKISALTVHGRTSAQLSKVLADWAEIAKVVTLRNQVSPDTLIIGNGDISSLLQASEMVSRYKVDGVMIGRGIFHNPWLFSKAASEISAPERLHTLQRHIHLWQKTWEIPQDFNRLKRFFKIYISDFDGAGQLRALLMEQRTPEKVLKVLEEYLAQGVK